MGRALKKHQQQELFGPVGRPRKLGRVSAPHRVRPELNGRFPVHVVLRAVGEVGSLRKRFMYHALREATIAVALRELNDVEDQTFRIVHISIQRTHVHLIVEAANKTALARGMQSFQISAAKHINRGTDRLSARDLALARRLAETRPATNERDPEPPGRAARRLTPSQPRSPPLVRARTLATRPPAGSSTIEKPTPTARTSTTFTSRRSSTPWASRQAPRGVSRD